jgi:hypothetical protein
MNVRQEIARISQYGQQLEQFFVEKQFKLSGDRDLLIVGYWSLLLDYHVAIVTLLPKELYGAAFALMRPIVEAWVRVHVVKMGSDAVVRQIKNDTYKIKFDRVGKEIDKAFGLEFFDKSLSKAVRDALHSYTHSGGLQIARRFDKSQIKVFVLFRELRRCSVARVRCPHTPVSGRFKSGVSAPTDATSCGCQIG